MKLQSALIRILLPLLLLTGAILLRQLLFQTGHGGGIAGYVPFFILAIALRRSQSDDLQRSAKWAGGLMLLNLFIGIEGFMSARFEFGYPVQSIEWWLLLTVILILAIIAVTARSRAVRRLKR